MWVPQLLFKKKFTLNLTIVNSLMLSIKLYPLQFLNFKSLMVQKTVNTNCKVCTVHSAKPAVLSFSRDRWLGLCRFLFSCRGHFPQFSADSANLPNFFKKIITVCSTAYTVQCTVYVNMQNRRHGPWPTTHSAISVQI